MMKKTKKSLLFIIACLVALILATAFFSVGCLDLSGLIADIENAQDLVEEDIEEEPIKEEDEAEEEKETEEITEEVSEETISNSEIVGTWIYQSDTAIYSINFAVAYTVSTFIFNSDGTCFYESLPVILREPTSSIEDAERENLLNTYPIRYPGMAVPEYEGGLGTYTYLGKGNYIQEDAVGYAKLELETTSFKDYDYENFIYLMDPETLVFYGTEFTKKE